MASVQERYDLVVIGFGKAGKTLAMKRAKAGERVALVERDAAMYGGTCINIGCVPTKTLIADMERFEISGGDGATAFKAAQRRRTALVAKLNAANLAMAQQSGVEVILGEGRFADAKTVAVRTRQGERMLRGAVVVIDTGSVPVMPDIPGIDLAGIHTSTSIQQIEDLPRRLAILGGGPIALEFATLFSGFGSQVHILNRGPKALQRFDADVAEHVQEVLEARGIVFHLGTTASSFEKTDEGLCVSLSSGGALDADAVLVAAGRRPATELLDLSAAGIETTPRGAVKVDKHLRTTAEGVYAAGDVTGEPQFTYVSFDDHRIILEDVWGACPFSGAAPRSTDARLIPTTTFIEPPLSTVGMGEDACAEASHKVVVKKGFVGQMPLVPRAKIASGPAGMAKFVIDAETDLILGATLFCLESQELINTVATAMRAGMTATAFGNGIYTHPTMSELFNALLG